MISLKRILREVILLQEGKREMLVYCRKHGIPDGAVDLVYEADPTPSHKYGLTLLRWMVNYDKQCRFWFKQHGQKDNEISIPLVREIIRLSRDTLKKFDELNQFYGNVDIQKFKSVTEFNDYVVKTFPYTGQHISKNQIKKIGKSDKDRTKIFENNKCMVVSIHTFDAACVYGQHTKWCITWEKKYFDNYINDYKIFVLIDNEDEKKYAVLVARYGTPKNIVVFNEQDKMVWSTDIEAAIVNFSDAFEDIDPDVDEDEDEYQNVMNTYKRKYIIDFDRLLKTLDIGIDIFIEPIHPKAKELIDNLEKLAND